MSNAEAARLIVDSAYAALFERGDLDGFLSDFDENSELIEQESLPYGGIYRGKDAIRSAIQGVFGYWKDFAYGIESIVYGEEYVMAYGRFSATSVKTGRSVSFPLSEVWKIHDGRVALVHPIYGDTKQAVEALA
jgi:ketosteroid isomerase-like protein